MYGQAQARLSTAYGRQADDSEDSDGNYVLELDTTETYNVVLNNGSGTQSADLKNLNGASVLEVANSSYNSKIVSTGSSGGGSTEPTEDRLLSTLVLQQLYRSLYLCMDDDKTEHWRLAGNKLPKRRGRQLHRYNPTYLP